MKTRNRRKVWNTAFVLVVIIAIILGYRTVRDNAFNQRQQVAVYNEWMQLMSIANFYLNSEGEGEKPKKGALFENPDMALFQADNYFNRACSLAQGAADMSSGRLSQIDTLLGMTSEKLSEEIETMYDQGTYRNGQFHITTPVKILMSNRDFMHTAVTETVLKGMPISVKNVGEIKKEYNHLNSLSLGVFSTDYKSYMQRTGQLKVSNNG